MAFAQIDEYYLERFHLLTRNEIIVFSYLLKKRNDGTLKCNPNLATIAREMGIAAPRVTEAVKGLEAKNWIVWTDSGNFRINEKVTDCVTSQVTNCVRKSYAKRKLKLRNAEVEVTQSVSCLIRIENTSENTSEKREPAHAEEIPALPVAAGVYEEIFPVSLDGYRLTELTRRLPEVDAVLWRQVLMDWRLNGYKSANVSGMIDAYNRQLQRRPSEFSFGGKYAKHDYGEYFKRRNGNETANDAAAV